MRGRVLACFWFGAAGALACASEPPAPVVPSTDPATLRRLPTGDVIGRAGRYGGHAWLGLPYAEPPQGELRWRAPQPLLPWTGTREALAFGASCPQPASPVGGDDSAAPGVLVGSEDCLYLNVYAPAFAPEQVPAGPARLPVMLWIHGGGNTTGAARTYDGSRLAATHGRIVVMLNYRLGALGWLRHAALREGREPAEASGNFGTLDQIHALHWVRDNVAGFGGDPGNVTIFGESAGGQNVLALLVSPLAGGLFHRAIVQSGGTWSRTPAEAEHFVDDAEPGNAQSSSEILLRLLSGEADPPDRAAAKAALAAMPPAEIATFLRGVPVERLFAAYRDGGPERADPPRVFLDGAVLPAEPLHLAIGRAGAYHAVPVVLGSNRDEQKLFAFLDPRQVRRWFGFPRAKDPARYQRDAAYRSRVWKITGVDDPARALAQAQPGRVFAYRFDWDEEPRVFGVDLAALLGAAHGLEIPFVFGHWDFGREGRMLFDAANAPGREALSTMMMSYWAEFAATGDPGRGRDGTLPRWGAWQEDGEKYVVLDTPAGGGVRMATESERLEDVAAALLADPSFEDDAERCRALTRLDEWTSERAAAVSYASAGDGRCAAALGVPAGPRVVVPAQSGG
jgi:para-nitrobenzyl esterase